MKVHEGLCDADHCIYGDLGGSFCADSNHLSRYGIPVVAAYFDVLRIPN